MQLYVGNISYNTTEQDLQAAFEEYGAVQSVKIITDRDSGNSKGFGFVEMSNDEEAENAIQQLDGSDIGGRNIKVNKARPSKPRDSKRRF